MAASLFSEEQVVQSADRQKRLYQIVAQGIIQSVNEGRYVVGQRLPAERELAIEYGVSRPTVREAVVALEVRGLVEVRLGSGVYVLRAPSDVDDTGDCIGAFELTEARLLFEGEAAALAATEMTAVQLDELDKLVTQIDVENKRGMAGEVPDREFHIAIARGTGNAVIVRAVEMFWNLRSGSPECAVLFARARTGGSKPVVEEHARIVRALRTRNPAAARAAMRGHLNAVIEHLLATTEAEAIQRAKEEAATARIRLSRAAQV